jgi:hypothetical protein
MRARLTVIAFGCLLLAAAASTPSQAGFDVDFGASVRVGDDTDLYFAISSRYFDRDRAVVERWGARYSDPDDLAISLFISKHSHRSLDAIFALRSRGHSWWDISMRLGVPVDVWFVPVQRRPGPPYGKAYGHWRHHRRHRRAVVLTDADLGNLVAVRMLHEYYSVPVEVAMEWRSSGRPLNVLMSGEYAKRHGHKSAAPGKSKGGKPGKGKGRGRGRGRHH